MIKNRDLPAYFFILLVSTFLTCSVDAQEKAENKIYADEHMQFLLPEKFRGESDTAEYILQLEKERIKQLQEGLLTRQET